MLAFIAFFYHWWMVLVPFIGIPIYVTAHKMWQRWFYGPQGPEGGVAGVLANVALLLISSIYVVTLLLNTLGIVALFGVPTPTTWDTWDAESFPAGSAAILPACIVSWIELAVLIVLVRRPVATFLEPFFGR
jgi:hypothetical protein